MIEKSNEKVLSDGAYPEPAAFAHPNCVPYTESFLLSDIGLCSVIFSPPGLAQKHKQFMQTLWVAQFWGQQILG
jgi:hypothetical protein